jgi:hypothetical protein
MKIRKKVLILLIFIIFLIFFNLTFSYFLYARNIQNKVLSHLRENLEFCEILKADISFPKGEFWLVCNNRPFYAEYKNGKVSYELNGWGFLKRQPEILNELKEEGCNFYQFADNNLIFICKGRKVKFYEFTFSDFKLKKIDEDLSINLFSDLVRAKYNCLPLGEEVFELKGETFFKLIADCGGKKTVFAFNFEKNYLTLPIVIEERIPNKERAELSFQLINVCKPDYIQEADSAVLLGMDCNLGKPNILYDFELGLANFLIKESEFENLFPYLGKYNLENMAGIELKYLKEEEKNDYIFKYYLAKEMVIVAKSKKGNGLISEFYWKNEGLWQ